MGVSVTFRHFFIRVLFLQAIYELCKDQIKERKQTIIKTIGYPENTFEKQVYVYNITDTRISILNLSLVNTFNFNQTWYSNGIPHSMIIVSS